MDIGDKIYKTFIYQDRYKYILEGLGNTLIMAFFAVIIGIIIGVLIAIIRNFYKENKKLPILNFFCSAYITIIRGTPSLLQLMIIYYVIFKTSSINILIIGIISFGINSSAYVSEIIRAGIESIDKGQMEACKCLGLTYFQSMRFVILPQAFKNIMPALGNEFITLLKETSIAGYIGILELTKSSDIIASRTFDYFFPLISVAIIYLILTLGMSKLLKMIERKLDISVKN